MPKLKKDKIVLGVTGNIGCGKSTVARMLAGRQALIIDADRLAHELYLPKTGLYKKIIKAFGSRIIRPDGLIDRKKLAELIFSRRQNLIKLNALVHPELIKKIRQRIINARQPLVILDAALIIEAGLNRLLDKLVLVTATKKQQILRSQERLGLKKEVIARIMKSQISQKAKSRFADFIIDNSLTKEKTKKQVVSLRRKMWKS